MFPTSRKPFNTAVWTGNENIKEKAFLNRNAFLNPCNATDNRFFDILYMVIVLNKSVKCAVLQNKNAVVTVKQIITAAASGAGCPCAHYHADGGTLSWQAGQDSPD